MVPAKGVLSMQPRLKPGMYDDLKRISPSLSLSLNNDCGTNDEAVVVISKN